MSRDGITPLYTYTDPETKRSFRVVSMSFGKPTSGLSGYGGKEGFRDDVQMMAFGDDGDVYDWTFRGDRDGTLYHQTIPQSLHEMFYLKPQGPLPAPSAS